MNKHTKIYDLYEIVKVPFPFTDVKASKIRPALILSNKYFNPKVGSSIMAMITSIKPVQNRWFLDIMIEKYSFAGLPRPSLIRFKIFTLDNRLILGSLGYLSEIDQQSVQKKLREVFNL